MIFRLLALFVLFLGITSLLRFVGRMLTPGRRRTNPASKRRTRGKEPRPAEFEILDDDPPRR